MVWLNVIGWAGSAVLIWSLLQGRQLRLRAFNLVGCVVLIVYNWELGVWPQVGMNLVLAGINIWFLRGLLAAPGSFHRHWCGRRRRRQQRQSLRRLVAGFRRLHRQHGRRRC